MRVKVKKENDLLHTSIGLVFADVVHIAWGRTMG
jgi:hypothetical protein